MLVRNNLRNKIFLIIHRKSWIQGVFVVIREIASQAYFFMNQDSEKYSHWYT